MLLLISLIISTESTPCSHIIFHKLKTGKHAMENLPALLKDGQFLKITMERLILLWTLEHIHNLLSRLKLNCSQDKWLRSTLVTQMLTSLRQMTTITLAKTSIKKLLRKDFQWYPKKLLTDITNSERSSLWEEIKDQIMPDHYGYGLTSASLTMTIRPSLLSLLHTWLLQLTTGSPKLEASITASSSTHPESSSGSTSMPYMTETAENHILRNIQKNLSSCNEKE